jgi:cellulose synthase/poly-beta-1,6-N-acetylglucosamine synthase-like glycosyltransferase
MMLAPAITIATILYLVVLAALLVPALIVAVQVVAALPPYRRRCVPPITRPSIAVLVPAHNEAFGIAATLHSITDQLHQGDRLLVVADNCDDDTAAVARQHGAEVIERSDPLLRGKGYALDAGVRHLALAPRQVVVVIDADCLLRPYALGCLARTSFALDRPAQALYLMQARPGAAAPTVVAAFAWTIKNWLRPLGWSRLGLPCQLMGTGMALPWTLIAQSQLASGHLVEDMKLGLDCAEAGCAPLFCPEAKVTSHFPDNQQGSRTQRTRWEHGHLGTIVRDGPRLLFKGMVQRNGALCALALDACVPPLSLLLLLSLAFAALSLALAGASGAGSIWAVDAQGLPWILGVAPAAVLTVAIGLAWVRAGNDRLPLLSVFAAAGYVLRKIPLYLRFLMRRQVVWISSLRDKP